MANTAQTLLGKTPMDGHNPSISLALDSADPGEKSQLACT
jgi:hypothetical protein